MSSSSVADDLLGLVKYSSKEALLATPLHTSIHVSPTRGCVACMVLIVLIRATVCFNLPGGGAASYDSGTASVSHSPAKGPKNAGEPQNNCL